MTDQTFNASVGQVAGGDINNYGTDDLAGLGPVEVEAYRQHLIERLSDARKKLILNPITAWLTGGVIAFFLMIVFGPFGYPYILFLVILLGMLVPYLLFIPLQKKYGVMIHAYRLNITRIQIYQHSCGWI